jgi:hypothetical protein
VYRLGVGLFFFPLATLISSSPATVGSHIARTDRCFEVARGSLLLNGPKGLGQGVTRLAVRLHSQSRAIPAPLPLFARSMGPQMPGRATRTAASIKRQIVGKPGN